MATRKTQPKTSGGSRKKQSTHQTRKTAKKLQSTSAELSSGSLGIDQFILNFLEEDLVLPSLQGPIKPEDLKTGLLVIYFYPKDLTPGCTKEALEFSQLLPEFEKMGAKIIGVSRDSLSSHQKFQSKLNLSINLISDTSEKLCRLFDVIKPKSLYGRNTIGIERSTFIIKDGQIIAAFRNVKAQGHAQKVLDWLRENVTQ